MYSKEAEKENSTTKLLALPTKMGPVCSAMISKLKGQKSDRVQSAVEPALCRITAVDWGQDAASPRRLAAVTFLPAALAAVTSLPAGIQVWSQDTW